MKIELVHLRKEYEAATPIRDLCATVNEGDVISVIGPSGTGKSTLLRCINMLERPTSGSVFVDGVDITDPKCDLSAIRQKIGMVFQSFNLFDHLSVVENVMLAPVHLKHLSRTKAYEIAMKQLAAVGLADRAFEYPDSLSGGQKQRVSIARTLAMDPEVILFDEPTSALDPTMVREVESVICKLAKTGKTIMIVTHEMRLAKAIANRVFYLDNGGLYEEGTPEQIFCHPQRERTRAFINRLRVFKYKSDTAFFSVDDFSAKLRAYAENNDIPEEISLRLHNLLYTFATLFLVPRASEGRKFDLLVEYGDEAGTVDMLLFYEAESGKKEEEKRAILKAFEEPASASVEEIDDSDYTLKAVFRL